MKKPRRDLKSEPEGMGATISYGLIEGFGGADSGRAIVDGDDEDRDYYEACESIPPTIGGGI